MMPSFDVPASRTKRPRRLVYGRRDQSLTKFAATLQRFNEAVGGRGAVLVDAAGEAVDYAGVVEPFELKVIGAELRLILDLLKPVAAPEAEIREFALRARGKSFGVYEVAEGYVIVLQLGRYALRVSRRALCEAVHELCTEAGWDVPAAFTADHWLRVQVRESHDRSRRPEALWVDGHWSGIQIIGRWADGGRADASRDVGYRVRLEGGAEVNLVREPLERWFADGAIQAWFSLTLGRKQPG